MFSLQMWETETAADVLKLSFYYVWYMFNKSVATSRVAKLHPALIDYAVMFSMVLQA